MNWRRTIARCESSAASPCTKSSRRWRDQFVTRGGHSTRSAGARLPLLDSGPGCKEASMDPPTGPTPRTSPPSHSRSLRDVWMTTKARADEGHRRRAHCGNAGSRLRLRALGLDRPDAGDRGRDGDLGEGGRVNGPGEGEMTVSGDEMAGQIRGLPTMPQVTLRRVDPSSKSGSPPR